MIQEFSEQELIRRESLAKLRELGIEPYPAALYPVNSTAKQISEEFDPEKGNFQEVCLAGRIMSRRIMGAASFGEIQDESGRIQIYVKRDEICPGEDRS
ncbi:MAG: OB-fold nucleic acid binding domain-containing protein, partial [Candidatus Cryptobacteroides sp.]